MPNAAGSTSAADSIGPRSSLRHGALFALGVLFSMNLLNYVDRYVFAAVGPAIIRDVQLTETQFGLLGSAFIVVYTLVSPAVGWLGDRRDRRKLLAFGVGLWSVATVATAFARTYNQMFLARAILGIGEASYGVVAPTLLADFFESKKRGRVMGIFYLALPVGAAIGYGVGGIMEALAAQHADVIHDATSRLGISWIGASLVGWRSAFWVVGLPGLAIAALGLAIREPARGASDGVVEKPAAQPLLSDYLSLIKTPSYLFNTAGMAAVTFTTGAFAHWIPTYFEYVHGTKPEEKWKLGVALAAAGLTGVLLGMWLPDVLQRKTQRAYLLWPGIAVLIAVPIGAFGLVAGGMYPSLTLLTLASVLMSSCMGPCNTVTANVVPGSRRAVGYALSIFLLHLFGDIPSPPMIGWVSRALGTPAARESALGRLLESVGAHPVVVNHAGSNLTAGMLLIVPVLLIGSICFFVGSHWMVRDSERAMIAGRGMPAESGIPSH